MKASITNQIGNVYYSEEVLGNIAGYQQWNVMVLLVWLQKCYRWIMGAFKGWKPK